MYSDAADHVECSASLFCSFYSLQEFKQFYFVTYLVYVYDYMYIR